MHLVFQQCKNFVAIVEQPAFSRPSDSSVQRNARQIYNLKTKKNVEKKTSNDITTFLGIMLEHSSTAENRPLQLDDVRPSLR